MMTRGQPPLCIKCNKLLEDDDGGCTCDGATSTGHIISREVEKPLQVTLCGKNYNFSAVVMCKVLHVI